MFFKFQLESITNTASDLNPLGKALTMTGQETDDEDGKRSVIGS